MTSFLSLIVHIPPKLNQEILISQNLLSWARGKFSAVLTEMGQRFFPRGKELKSLIAPSQNWSAVLQGKQLAPKPEVFQELRAKPPPPPGGGDSS